MKRCLFIHIALFLCVVMQAQQYDPLVEEGKQWNTLFSLFQPPTDPCYCTTTSYKFMGDTILDEVSYKKLYSTTHEDLSGWCLNGAMRENEIGQVFLRNFGSLNHVFRDETMLYVFSMQPGDSIWYYDPSECLKLLSVSDTILEGECVSRKAYYFSYEKNGVDNGDREIWIEGIGSLNGLREPGFYFFIGGYHNLLCYFEDENLIWHYPRINGCYVGVDGLEEIEAGNPISVCPNPASETVHIEGVQPAVVHIYNALGQMVKTVKDNNEISVAGLPEGVYLLRIMDFDGQIHTSRMAVSR